MPELSLDFRTTLIFAFALTLLFTAAVALLWPVLHREPAYRLLLSWNVIVLGSQVFRMSASGHSAPYILATYWTLLTIGNAVYCTAALAMISRLDVQRALYAFSALVVLSLWLLVPFSSSQQPMGMVFGLASAILYALTAFAVFRLIGEKHKLVRYFVTAPFALASILALVFATQRLLDWTRGVAGLMQRADTHFFAELIVIVSNLSVLLWLYLRQERIISHMARTDALTGALNRRGLEQALSHYDDTSATSRPQQASAIVMMDIDHFKRINDTHGHRAGDAVLREFSSLVLQHKRAADLFARLGGEEYCVLLPETTAQQATQWAERLRSALLLHRFTEAALASQAHDRALQVTASFGIAELAAVQRGWQAEFDEALARADDALYEAKASGRNRVIAHVLRV